MRTRCAPNKTLTIQLQPQHGKQQGCRWSRNNASASGSTKRAPLRLWPLLTASVSNTQPLHFAFLHTSLPGPSRSPERPPRSRHRPHGQAMPGPERVRAPAFSWHSHGPHSTGCPTAGAPQCWHHAGVAAHIRPAPKEPRRGSRTAAKARQRARGEGMSSGNGDHLAQEGSKQQPVMRLSLYLTCTELPQSHE